MTVLADAPKAATLDGHDVVHVGLADIAKWEDGPDGTLYVYGRATNGEIDTDDQVVWPPWSAKALQAWMDEAPTIRVQHNPQRDPAGSGVRLEIDRDGDGAHWIKAAVDEPIAQRLVKKRHLRAFSVGIAQPVIERDPSGKARGGIIKGGRICEVSLVDSPANRSCFLEIAKAAGDDGHAEFTGKVFGADLLTKDAGPKAVKTVTVELPKNMSVSIKPSDLAKLAALRPVLARENALAKAAVPEVAKARIMGEHGPELVTLNGGGAAVAKADLSDSDRDAMPASQFAYVDAQGGKHLPVHDEGHVRSALGRFAQQHFESPAARKKAAKKIVSRARGMGIDLAGHGTVVAAAGVSGKVAKAAAPPAKAGKRDAAKVATPGAAKKKKVMCGSCGARQNRKHDNCSECGKPLAGAIPVIKNHAYTCLGCGKDLDKGERFCPGCGKENPGYLPQADHQIPANQDKAARAGKVRVAKGRKAKGKVPGAGVVGQGARAGKPAGPHREPDGAEVEALERGAGMEDGDSGKAARLKAAKGKKKPGKKGKKLPPWLQDRNGDGDDDGKGAAKAAAPLEDPALMASLRLKALGVPPAMGTAHDLACPAFLPAEVNLCYPETSLSTLDLVAWQDYTLGKAAGGSLAEAVGVQDLLGAAVTLRAADPRDVADLREGAHKAFRDANPGPATFPSPAQIGPAAFHRPYLSAGHAAPSPGHDPPNRAAIPEVGGIHPEAFRRGFLQDGRADDSPANTHPSPPVPAPDRTGVPTAGPARTFYRNSARDSAQHAMQVLHDHIAATFPALCPMHPHVADTPVPTPQGVPAVAPAPGPAGTRKQAKAAKRKAARALARKRRRLEARVLKGKLGVDEARGRLGLEPVTRAAGAAPAVDAEAVKAAVTEATAPLAAALRASQKAAARSARTQAEQAKTIRKLRKTTDAIAALPDTSHAPFRGVALSKSSSPAGTAVAKSAEQAMAEQQYARLYHEWATTTDPSAQAALARVLAPYWNPAMAMQNPPT